MPELSDFLSSFDPQYTFSLENPVLMAEQGTSQTYFDGADVATIGFGHTGSNPIVGQEISFGEAVELGNKDIITAAQQILQDVNPEILGKLGQDAREALVDVVFNAGPLRNEAPKALEALNKGDFDTFMEEAFSADKGIVNVGGEPSAGLIQRRKSNEEKFMKGLPDVDNPPAGDPFAQLFFEHNPILTEDTSPLSADDLNFLINHTGQVGDPNSFRNILRGSIANANASLGKTVEIAGETFDMQDWEDFGAEMSKRATQEAVKFGQPEVASTFDIEDIGDIPAFIKFALAQAIPSMVAAMSTGLAGGTIGGAVAGPPGAAVGAVLGAFATSFALNTGELAREVEEQGGTDEANALTLGIGAFLGLLDVAGLTRVLKPVVSPFIKEVGVDALGDTLVKMGVGKGLAKGALEGIVAEGVTEGLQEATMLYSAAALTGNEIDPEELHRRVLDAVAIGSIAGATTGSMSGTVGTFLNNSEVKALQAEDERANKVLQKLIQSGELPNDTTLQDFYNLNGVAATSYALLDPDADSVVSVQNAHTRKGREPGFGRLLMEVVGGKGITLLDRAASFSPAMNTIRNSIVRKEGPEGQVGADLFETSEVRYSKWASSLLREMRKLKKEDLAQLPSVMRGHVIPEVDSTLDTVSRSINTLMAEVRDTGELSGLDIGLITNYFPRFYNVRALQKNPELQNELVTLAIQYGATPASARRTVKKIIKGQGIILGEDLIDLERFNNLDEVEQAIAEGKTFRGQRPGRTETQSKSPALENRRVFHFIPDEKLEKFLLNNPAEVLPEYLRQAAKRISYAELWGPREEKLKTKIVEAAAEMDEAGRPMTQVELNRIYDMNDAFLGLYKPITHLTTRRVNDVLTSANYITLLPISVLSMLQEPLIALTAGGKAFTSGVAKAIESTAVEPIRKVFRWGKNGNKHNSAEEVRQDLQDFGFALDRANAERLAATFGGQTQPEPALDDFERGIQKVTNTFFRLNLMGPFTKFFRNTSWTTGLNMVESRAKRLATNQAPPGSARFRQWREELRALGLNPQEAVDWVNRGGDRADAWFQNEAKMGAYRFTNGIVMHPTPANRPMWMNNPHFRLLSQLKGFQFVFGNTVIKRWFRNTFQSGALRGVPNAAGIAGVAILMTIVATMMNELREMLTYWDEDGNPRTKNHALGDKLWTGVQRSGFLGSTQFALDALTAHQFGAAPVDPLLGPSISRASGLLQGVSVLSIGGSPDKLRTELLKAIPGLSISPALREAIKDAL